MFFRKPKIHTCVVCEKPIESNASRFVEKNRTTKAERHTHIGCRNGLEPAPHAVRAPEPSGSPSQAEMTAPLL